MKEQILQLGQYGSLVGVLTPGQHKRVCVLLLNAGLLHHVGPAGLYVQLARALQQQGIASCRWDLSSIGDSPARPDHLPIFQTIVQEPLEVMNNLSTLGYEKFILLGICSGAYSAFHTALQDARVSGVVMINPEDLALGQQIGDAGARQTEASGAHEAWAVRYKRSLFRPQAWLNLLTGKVNYGRLWTTLCRRFSRGSQNTGTDPAIVWVQQRLQELLDRQVQVFCVTSQADVAIYYVQMLFAKWQNQPNPEQLSIRNTDHLFTHIEGRQRLLAVLVNWICKKNSAEV
jgi:pimeloyl-ACP methyl ester carboxylesterase